MNIQDQNIREDFEVEMRKQKQMRHREFQR